jgi:hypothetical protein
MTKRETAETLVAYVAKDDVVPSGNPAWIAAEERGRDEACQRASIGSDPTGNALPKAS